MKNFNFLSKNRWLLLPLLLITLSVGNAWGADQTVIWTASSGALGTATVTTTTNATGTISTGSYSWNYTRSYYSMKSGKSDYVAWSSANGYIQLGSSNFRENVSFTTSVITGTIKSISVNCASASGGHKLTIDVGGTKYLNAVATPSWSNNNGDTKTGPSSGTGSSSGAITISFTNGSGALYIKSISVTYNNDAPSCTAPTITSQPTGASYNKNATPTALSVIATGTSLTYQWYLNTTNSTSGASSISGATNSTYTPSTATAGTKYYYCIVSSSTCTTTSNIVAVTVNVPVSSVSLNKSSTTIIEDLTETLTATVSPNDATNKTVNWSSNNTDVATVNSSGVVTAKAAGTATIIATSAADNTKYAECTVTVTAKARDYFIDEVHSTEGYTGTGLAKKDGYSASIPTISDKSKPGNAETNCDKLHYHFVGWTADRNDPTAIATLNGTATGTTYYAVWAKEGSGTPEASDVIDVDATSEGIGSTATNQWAEFDITGSTGAVYRIRTMGTTNAAQWNTNGWLYCKSKPTSGAKLKSVTIVTTANKSINVFGSSNVYTEKPTSGSLNSLSATSSGATYTFTSDYDCIALVGGTTGIGITSITITYKGSVSYTDYITSCCTPLEISGAINVVPTRDGATVSWTKVADATGYEYKLGNGSWTTASVANLNSPSLSLTSLNTASEYTIYLRANGTGSNCAQGTATSGTTFKTLSRVTAATNDANKGTAKVSLTSGSGWADYVDAADGTTIYLQATPSSSSWALGSWSASSGDVASSQLTGWTGDVTVTATFASAELPTLGTPTGMNSSNVTAISATISWNAVANASSYAITCVGATQGDVTINNGVCSCTLTGLTAGTAYTWNVQAIGDNTNYKSGTACADQNFTTEAKKPTKVEITTDPTKTTYNSGEKFNATGMVVKVTYNNGDIDAAYTGYTLSPTTDEVLTPANNKVTVSATLNEVTKSADVNITVNAKLTWKAAGAADQVTYASAGKAVLPSSNPSAPSCLGEFDTFQGWSTAAIATSTTTEPSYVTAESDATTDATYYAVFARMTNGGTENASSTIQVKGVSAPGSPYEATDGCVWTYSSVTFGNTNPGFAANSSAWIQVDLPEEATEAVDYTITQGNSWGGSASVQFSSGSTNIVTFNSSSKSYTFTNSDKSLGTYKITNKGSQGAWIDHVTINYKKVGKVPAEWATTCCTEWSAPAISYTVPSGWKKGEAAVSVTIASGATHGTVSYESSDTKVLTVAANGAITAVGPGQATVTATWAGGLENEVKYCEASSSFDVTVSGTVTVHFEGNGNTSGSMSDQTVTYNVAETLSANAFTKTGYTFYGWADTQEEATAGTRDYTNGQSVAFLANTTLYAVWTINKHNVTLNQPTGNTITATGTAYLASVEYGTEITLSATENEGYVFTSWSVTGATVADASAKSTTFTMPDNDVSVSATYSTYTWDFSSYAVKEGTTPATSYTDVQTLNVGSVVVESNYVRSDDNTKTKKETYAGAWTIKLGNDVIVNGYAFKVADNGKHLTFWVGETKFYDEVLTVTEQPKDVFVDNIWNLSVSGSPFVDTYNLPSLSNQTKDESEEGLNACHDHFVFKGWTLDQSDASSPIAAGTEVTADNKTYYAVWAIERDETLAAGYRMVTSAPSSGTNVILAAKSGNKYYAMTTTLAAQEITLTNGAISSTDGLIFNYTSSGLNVGSNEYVHFNSGSFKVAGGTTNAPISITAVNGGAFKIKGTDQNKYLTFSDDGENQSFNTTSTESNFAPIYIFTQQAASTTKIYVDYIAECTARVTSVTVSGEPNKKSYEAGDSFDPAGLTVTANYSDDTHNTPTSGVTFEYDPNAPLTNGQTSINVRATYREVTSDWFTVSDLLVRQAATITIANKTIEVGQEWTIDGVTTNPAGAASAIIYTIKSGSDYVALDGNKLTGLAEGTATITATLEDGANYLAASKDFTVTVKPAAVHTDVVIYAEYGGKYYALSNTITAVEVTFEDGKMIVGDPATQKAIIWDRREVTTENPATRTATFYNKDVNKYLAGANGTGLSANSEEGDYTTWTWNDAYYYAGDASTRTIIYSTSSNGVFKNYAVTNAGNSGYSETALYYTGEVFIKIKPASEEETVNVNVSTLPDNSSVVVTNNATLTINEEKVLDVVTVEEGATVVVAAEDAKVDSLVVKEGGNVEVTEDVTVETLVLTAGDGKSGQVTGTNVQVNSDIYLDIKLLGDGTGTMSTEESQQWYCISAPFDVALSDGFYWGNGKPMSYNVDFQAFVYDGGKRADTGVSGWQRASGKLEAGKAYLIGFDDERTNYKTIRLKAMSKTIPTAYQLDTEGHDAAESTNSNWNGVGNPTLHYIALDGFTGKVQCYNNGSGYSPYDPATHNYVVGTALFMQAEDKIDLKAATNANVRAPKRVSEENERCSFCVEIAKEGAKRCDNRLYISTSDEATSSYEQGKDMLSMNGTSSKFAALIWTKNYGMRLSSEDVPMINKQATYSLGIYAPKNGIYTISATEASENANLYLTKNGAIIWNLTKNPYTIELEEGTTEGYGLILVKRMPQDVETVNGDASEAGVQKVVINDKVFILRGEKLYDLTGKAVR